MELEFIEEIAKQIGWIGVLGYFVFKELRASNIVRKKKREGTYVDYESLQTEVKDLRKMVNDLAMYYREQLQINLRHEERVRDFRDDLSRLMTTSEVIRREINDVKNILISKARDL